MNPWRRLPWPAWVSITALLAFLAIINSMLTPDYSLEVSTTSYGRAHAGYGAVYELLHELGLEPQRSRTLYQHVDQARPLWLLTPNFLATSGAADLDGVDDDTDKGASAEPLADALRGWIERGGTAIVFGDDRSEWEPWALRLDASDDLSSAEATGPLSTRTRALDSETELVLFDLEADDPQTDGEPSAANALFQVADRGLIVERRMGAGRLVAVSDGRLLANRNLDKADNALLAVDLVRAYGLPRIDERCHGLLSDVSVLGALGTGRAALLFVTLGGFGLLLLWQRRATPVRSLAPVSELDASLARFVDSLSLLYFRRAPRHENEVFTAYRHGFRHRLRRLLFGRGSADDRLLTQRIRRDLADDAATLAAVEGRSIPTNARQLREAVRALERYGASLVRGTHARRSR